jgi:hypothetical protein
MDDAACVALIEGDAGGVGYLWPLAAHAHGCDLVPSEVDGDGDVRRRARVLHDVHVPDP